MWKTHGFPRKIIYKGWDFQQASLEAQYQSSSNFCFFTNDIEWPILGGISKDIKQQSWSWWSWWSWATTWGNPSFIYIYRYRLVHHDHSSSDGNPGAFLRRLVWLCLQSRSIRITKQEHIETINFMGVPGVPNFKKCPKFPFQSISVSIIRGDPHAVGNC